MNSSFKCTFQLLQGNDNYSSRGRQRLQEKKKRQIETETESETEKNIVDKSDI